MTDIPFEDDQTDAQTDAQPPVDLAAEQPEEELAQAPARYAVYDNTLLRFVSEPLDSIEEAEERMHDGANGHDLEIREV